MKTRLRLAPPRRNGGGLSDLLITLAVLLVAWVGVLAFVSSCAAAVMLVLRWTVCP